MYSLTVSLCYTLQDELKKLNGKPDENWFKMCDYFFRFSMDNFTTELSVMGARVAITTYALPIVPNKLKNFDEFFKRFGKYITNATNN
jgi:hypothetical protein